MYRASFYLHRCAMNHCMTVWSTQPLQDPRSKSSFQSCPEVWSCSFENLIGVRLPSYTKILVTTLGSRTALSRSLRRAKSTFGYRSPFPHSRNTILITNRFKPVIPYLVHVNTDFAQKLAFKAKKVRGNNSESDVFPRGLSLLPVINNFFSVFFHSLRVKSKIFWINKDAVTCNLLLSYVSVKLSKELSKVVWKSCIVEVELMQLMLSFFNSNRVLFGPHRCYMLLRYKFPCDSANIGDLGAFFTGIVTELKQNARSTSNKNHVKNLKKLLIPYSNPPTPPNSEVSPS